MAFGTAFGGWRLIRTMGAGFYASEHCTAFHHKSPALAWYRWAVWGAPVGTTQVISSSIVGAGDAERINKVRWGMAHASVSAWLLTSPVYRSTGRFFVLVYNLSKFGM